MALPDELNLTRRGPAQIDRVIVNPARVRMDDGGIDATLRALSQISDTVGGVLARRAAERRQREEEQMLRDAQLKAFNPDAFRAAVEAGTAKEWEHPDFAIRYDAFKAQADEGRLQEHFAAIDPNGSDEEIEAAIGEARGMVSEGSPAYLSAMGPILAQQESRLRSRVAAARLDRQNADAYANFVAGLNGGVGEAIRSGNLEAARAFLDQQVAVADGLGQSRAKTAEAILDAAKVLVSEHPALSDFFDDYVVPGLGRIGDLAPGVLDDTAASAVRAFRAEQRALRAEQRQIAAEQSRDAQRQAWMDLLAGRTPSAETLAAASYADPDFIVTWESKRRAFAKSIVSPDPITYTDLRVRSLRGYASYEEAVDARLQGKIDDAQFDRIVGQISGGGNSPLNDPVYTKILQPVRGEAAKFVLPKEEADTLDVGVRTVYREAERAILDEAQAEVQAAWADLAASGLSEPEKVAAAQQLREQAFARAQSRLADLRFDDRFRGPLATPVQPAPPDFQPFFDRVPGSSAVFSRLPAADATIELIDPALLDRAVAFYGQGDTTPAELVPMLDALRVQLGIPPNVSDEALVLALQAHLTGTSGTPGAQE